MGASSSFYMMLNWCLYPWTLWCSSAPCFLLWYWAENDDLLLEVQVGQTLVNVKKIARFWVFKQYQAEISFKVHICFKVHIHWLTSRTTFLENRLAVRLITIAENISDSTLWKYCVKVWKLKSTKFREVKCKNLGNERNNNTSHDRAENTKNWVLIEKTLPDRHYYEVDQVRMYLSEPQYYKFKSTAMSHECHWLMMNDWIQLHHTCLKQYQFKMTPVNKTPWCKRDFVPSTALPLLRIKNEAHQLCATTTE